MGRNTTEQKIKNLAWLSFIVSIVITAMKWAAYLLTSSVAFKSDAYEGLVNILASSVALLTLSYSRIPKDADHPYGHGKIEYFSAAFEGGLISLAGILILYESVKSFYMGMELKSIDAGLWLNAGAGMINGVVALILLKASKKYHSISLEADGKHLMSDFLTTIVLFVGVLIIRFTNWNWLDPLLAFFVSLLLLKTGYELIRKSIDSLIDTQDPLVIDTMIKRMNEFKTSEVISAHGLRMKKAGHEIYSEIHIVIPEYFDVKSAHHLVTKFTDLICAHSQPRIHLTFHLDPCEKNFCESCAIKDCSIRMNAFNQEEVFSFKSVTKEEEES